MRRDIQKFVAACPTCQATKYIRDKPNGLIQPLPIPDCVWEAASMDFIVGLPPSHGYTAIMVVVDRLSKYAHFAALKPGFDAPRVARLFVDTVVKLHGFPKKLLSDRDAIFMSDFWQELITLSGSKLQFTTAYHPQTDGQSEVTNRALEQFLRAYTFDCPQKWYPLLAWAELALNCSTNASIGMSPYQALYGREPPSIFDTYSKPSHNTTVADILRERETLLRTLKQRIQRAQLTMAAQANRHRKDVEFAVGDEVLLRLQPYRQHSVGKPISNKLGRRFYGPFKVTERIGKVAYRLQLPLDSRIHDVFHVSLLRPFIQPWRHDSQVLPPAALRDGAPNDVPVRASAARTVLVAGVPQDQWLVHWGSSEDASPSWEPVDVIRREYPHLHLEDKVVALEGGVDTTTDVHAKPPEAQPVAAAQKDPGVGPRKRRGQDSKPITKSERPKRVSKIPARYADE